MSEWIELEIDCGPIFGEVLLNIEYSYWPGEPANYEDPGSPEDFEVLQILISGTEKELPLDIVDHDALKHLILESVNDV